MSGRTRDPDRLEQVFLWDVLSNLKSAGSLGTGRLYSSVCPGENYPRNDFEELLKALTREGFIKLREDSFDKDGKTIHYKRAELTSEGYSFDKKDIMNGIIVCLLSQFLVLSRNQCAKYQLKKNFLAFMGLLCLLSNFLEVVQMGLAKSVGGKR